tara:strand:- start:11728 stop:11886 length:159 start_codon:yes stop_codon:yes gene_type:complete
MPKKGENDKHSRRIEKVKRKKASKREIYTKTHIRRKLETMSKSTNFHEEPKK